jgi:serine phosphatase RsbU (regulator of sigma subunit)
VVAPTSYHQFTVPLEKGDLVLAYTDSLIESGHETGQALGIDGLLEQVRQIDLKDPAQFFRKLLAIVADRQNHQPTNDDLTLLLLHHNAASPPPQSMGEMVKVIGKMLHLNKV